MAKPIRIIKKYPNRRLYDTANSGYITLADVKQMVLEFIDFQVIDAKSGDDLTRSILLQIILEEESVGVPMFSSEMLSQMIRFYGNALQGIMGNYMEQNVKAFMAIQGKLQDQAKQIYGDKMMLTPGPVEAVSADAGAGDAGHARQLSRAERQAVHGYAAADAGPDARAVHRVPLSQFRRDATIGATTRKSADAAKRRNIRIAARHIFAPHDCPMTPKSTPARSRPRRRAGRPASALSRSAARRRWSTPSRS